MRTRRTNVTVPRDIVGAALAAAAAAADRHVLESRREET